MSYLLRSFSAAVLVVSLMGCSSVSNCGEDSVAVAYARSLSQERLGQMHRDLKVYADAGRYLSRVEKTNAPEEFSDLEFHNVLVDGSRARLMLEGCFDHYVTIEAHGVVRDQPAELVLLWGDGPGAGRELLWSNDS